MAIVDSIMGTGKTSAMISKMNHSYGIRFIYVTPYLPEVERVLANTTEFYQPKELGKGKLDSLHDLLCNGKNIVTTHALFLRATKETMQLIYHGKYILVLDEALEVLHEFNSVVARNKQVNSSTVKWLIEKGFLTVDEKYNAIWNDTNDADFQFSEIVNLSQTGSLKCVRNNLYVEYSPEIFRTFQRIFVLTYLFEGSMLSSFFKTHGFSYEMLSARKNGDNYELCEYNDAKEIRKQFAELITIYEGQLNDIGGDNPNAFSINWLRKRTPEQINAIKKCMRNYKNHVSAKSSDVMWTTVIEGGIKDKLNQKGFKYIRKLKAEEKKLPDDELKELCQFVPCNARATNMYADRTVLMYMLNRFLNPNLLDYFEMHGYRLDEDQFALSELLQWVWRSAIRNGQPISIYVPSIRMRNLLKEWLNFEPV